MDPNERILKGDTIALPNIVTLSLQSPAARINIVIVSGRGLILPPPRGRRTVDTRYVGELMYPVTRPAFRPEPDMPAVSRIYLPV